MRKPQTIGIVISTYNNPAWLEKTLWGYLYQTRPADEIIIADDGSRDDTRQLIDSFRDKLPIKHVWHEDNGFQKSRILNKALIAAESEYLIFTDQVPHWEAISLWLPFFHRETPVFVGTEKIARKIDSTAYYMSFRKERRGRYVATFQMISNDVMSLPEDELTKKYYALLEDNIRECPELWLWTHRRWKRTRARYQEWNERRLKRLKEKSQA